jgi:glutamate-1-semialdehyde 2,1-aminomutase
LKFNYNDIASLKKLFDEYPKKIAAVILEPVTNAEPKDDFLNNVKDLCKKNGSVLIFDEMITGFRWHIKGAQKYFGVEPDLSTFGKGIANGFSVAALTGKKEIMNLGGILKEGEEKVFLISTTHGAEMSSLGAMVKTIDVYKKLGVVEHIWKYGKKLVDGVNAISKDMGIKDHFYFEGYPCSPNYVAKDKDGRISLELRTLFSQEMVKGGVLMPWIAISYSHGNKELEMTLEAAKKALGIYSLALEKGAHRYLKGKAVKPVFRKLN